MQNREAFPPPVVRRTSRLGRASFMIALSIFLLVLASVGVMMLFSLNNSKSANAVIAVSLVGWLVAPLGHFVGLVMGIVDICRKGSKKLTPALGIAGNAVLGGIGIGLIFLVLSVLGSALGAFR